MIKQGETVTRYSCDSLFFSYLFDIIDECIHALVGYGRHGKTDAIQDLRCQACGTKFSMRRGTALLSSEDIFG